MNLSDALSPLGWPDAICLEFERLRDGYRGLAHWNVARFVDWRTGAYDAVLAGTELDEIDRAINTLEDATPAPTETRPARRGRRKGESRINIALTFVVSRMKDDLPTDLTCIAKDAGCSEQNMRQSKKFMNAYRILLAGNARVPKGAKTNGRVEARDNDDEDNF